METKYINGKRAVTFGSLIREIMSLIPDNRGRMDDVLGETADDAATSLRRKTMELCKAYAGLESHVVGSDSEDTYFVDAIDAAEVALVSGYLRDVLRLLLKAQWDGAAELCGSSEPFKEPLLFNT